MTVVVRTYQFAGVSRPTLTLAGDVVTRGRVITFTFLTAAGPECPSRTGISAHSALQIITIKNTTKSTIPGTSGWSGGRYRVMFFIEKIVQNM